MKPDIASVQRRLGLAVTPRHTHDFRMKSTLHAGRGGRLCVTYRCAVAGCDATKSVAVTGNYPEPKRAGAVVRD